MTNATAKITYFNHPIKYPDWKGLGACAVFAPMATPLAPIIFTLIESTRMVEDQWCQCFLNAGTDCVNACYRLQLTGLKYLSMRWCFVIEDLTLWYVLHPACCILVWSHVHLNFRIFTHLRSNIVGLKRHVLMEHLNGWNREHVPSVKDSTCPCWCSVTACCILNH